MAAGLQPVTISSAAYKAALHRDEFMNAESGWVRVFAT